MRARIGSLRSTRFDELGLRRVLADRMLPSLVAAMAFLAALAIAGWMGAEALSGHWERGAASTFTVQVPRAGDPDASGSGTRLAAVESLLSSAPSVESAKTMSDAQLDALIRPWLGTNMKDLPVPVPAVISVHMNELGDLAGLAARLARSAPGTIMEDHATLGGRLGTLARSLQLCSGMVLMVVALVTAAVIAVATNSGLVARREAILIVYQLGATDGYIARRFAIRAAVLSCIGAAIGGVLALPVVFTLTALAAPLAGRVAPILTASAAAAFLPRPLWLLPLILPTAAAVIGYIAAQITMRRWLHQFP